MASPPALAAFQFLSLNSAANYDPSSQGAITNLAFSFDLLLESGDAAGYGLAAVQNGRVYRHYFAGLDANAPVWTPHSVGSVSAGQFHEINLTATTYAGVVNTASHPDFSAAGSNIQFGYIVLNGFGGTVTAETGIDNWSVTITNETPEPSTLGAAAMAMAVLAMRRYLVFDKRR